ncbi:hypothetical protein UT300012_23000 [Paraclostridium bifermentans]
MCEQARALLGMNRFNPEVTYKLDREMEKLLTKDDTESKELYDELLKFRSPVLNPNYGKLFNDFSRTNIIEIDKMVRRYSLDLIIGAVSFAQDLVKFCNVGVKEGYIGYNKPYCKQQLMACASEFMKLNKEGDESKWLWYKWLEVATIRALRRNTVYMVDIEPVIKLLRIGNNIKKNIINEYFSDDDVMKEYHMLAIEVEEKFFEGREALDEFEDSKRSEYFKIEAKTKKEEQDRDMLFGRLLALFELYTMKPKTSPASFYIEYVETQVTKVPPTLLFYHTPEEALDCFTECAIFLKAFETKSLKDALVEALIEDGQGVYRRYDDVSFQDYAIKNLKILASKGILAPDEYMHYMEKLGLFKIRE